MDLEAELDELLREAGWAGMSWSELTNRYAKMAADDLKAVLNRLIARKKIYRFLRPHGTGRTSAFSTLYYSYWPASTDEAVAERRIGAASDFHRRTEPVVHR